MELGLLDSEMPGLGPRGCCEASQALPPVLGTHPGTGQVALAGRHLHRGLQLWGSARPVQGEGPGF